MKARQTSGEPLLLAAAAAALFVIGAVMASAPTTEAADKSRRGNGDASSNNSIRTQELTADAFAEQRSRTSRPASRPSDTPDDWRTRLSDVEDRIRAEDERHQAAVADLRKTAKGAKGKKALDKEQATYEQRRTELDEQRQSLLVKLNGDDVRDSSATTRPSKTAAKKPAKASKPRNR